MAERSHVPKFGNWDGDENVPYTVYFEKARKGRSGGKMINPNDPEDNPDLVSDSPDRSGGGRLVSEEPRVGKTTETEHENMNRRAGHESVPQRFAGRGEGQKRPARQGPQSIGSDNSMEQSPLHPKGRVSGRGTVGAPSPSWEGGKGSYESSHGTPGRSRLKPKANESPDKGAAVPKFGEWDESNPQSSEGYTRIFANMRHERQFGEGKVPGKPSHPGAGRHSSSNSSSCCFPWGRK